METLHEALNSLPRAISSTLTAAYLGAVVDTDGSVFINANGQACFNVEQVGGKWVEEIRSYAGGIGTVSVRPPRRGVPNTVHSWSVRAQKDLLYFLARVSPFVKKKNKEVDVVLRYLRGTLELSDARKRLQKIRNAYREDS